MCSHLTFASAFSSTSPSKFNIASMEMQTQMQKMGLNPFLTFYIDIDANVNANVRCEHTFIHVIIHISAELEDAHILELSKKFTNLQDLRTLGINGLNLPMETIDAALYDNRDRIQDMAYSVLSEWAKQQQTKSKAYANIIACLRKCQMIGLANELRQWVEGAAFTEQISKESKFLSLLSLYICGVAINFSDQLNIIWTG